MGKKYIIDLNPDCVEGEYLRIPARIAGEEQWLVTKAALTPYTEPDLELIKEKAHTNGYGEGYQDGYSEGMNDYLQNPEVKEESDRAYAHGYSDAESKFSEIRKEAYEDGYNAGFGRKIDASYQEGLADAWDAARKIVIGDINFIGSAFGSGTRSGIIRDLTASEVIKVLKDYEQEQDAEIKVGDEVIPRETEYDTMIVTRLWKDDYDSNCIDAIGFDGRISSFLVSRVSKTGKHYEIAAVLEKMRGEQDG